MYFLHQHKDYILCARIKDIVEINSQMTAINYAATNKFTYTFISNSYLYLIFIIKQQDIPTHDE